jgi:hypothetical protein
VEALRSPGKLVPKVPRTEGAIQRLM